MSNEGPMAYNQTADGGDAGGVTFVDGSLRVGDLYRQETGLLSIHGTSENKQRFRDEGKLIRTKFAVSPVLSDGISGAR